MPELSAWEAVARLALAVVLAGGIGLERELREHEAGLRTHMLVALGSALFTLVSIYAWADQTLSASLATPVAIFTASQSNFHSGWTVGGGLEYLFAPNWSGKIEYMYADIGTTTFGTGTLVAGGVGVGHTLHTIKGGINYHFNWGGPVVARY